MTRTRSASWGLLGCLLVVGWGMRAQAAPRSALSPERQQMLQQLESTRQASPEQYRQARETLERQWAIQDIVEALRLNKMEPAVARSRLTALVEADMREGGGSSVEAEIDALKQRLAELEQMKRDPRAAVQARVEQLLETARPIGAGPTLEDPSSSGGR